MENAIPAGRRVEKSRTSRCHGRVVRVPLGDGRCAYGRQLRGARVEFYDHAGSLDEVVDLLQLVDTPVAFAVAVMDAAFRRSGSWELLDVVPLSQGELSAVYRSAKRDQISGRLSIYWEDGGSGRWGETPATVEECRVLEVAAVWSAEHVEDRLRDHFDGRPNKWLESLRELLRSSA